MNEVEYAKQYPFERAGHSYLFVDGNIIPISNFNSISWEKCTLSETGNPEISIAQYLSDNFDEDISPLKNYIPVIAAGSNASPGRLAQKYKEGEKHTILPVIRGVVKDFVSVYSAHFTKYGSIAATLQYSPGAHSDAYLTYLDPDQLEVMHATESLGSYYAFGKLDNIEFIHTDEQKVDEIYLYVTLGGGLWFDNSFVTLAEIEKYDCEFLDFLQPEILARSFQILGGADDLDGFIAKLIATPEFRSECTQRIREHARPFGYSDVEYLLGHGA